MSEGRIILNANIGKTNVVDFETFAKITIDTLDEIIKTILPLCGVDAMYDLVIYKNLASEYMSNIFSNDGIHILKSIEHMSPIQTYITNYIRYIAERVEKAAGDGTSTAIFISCSLISALLHELTITRSNISVDPDTSFIDQPKKLDTFKLLHTLFCRKLNEISPIISSNRIIMEETNMLNNEVKMFLQHILEFTKDLRIDVQTLQPNARKELIRKLAFTTSKGNEKLTEYAVQLFSELPEILYEHTTYTRLPIETDEDLKVETPDCDVKLSVFESANTQYNSQLNTELIHEHCDLLVLSKVYGSLPMIESFLKTRDEDPDALPMIIVFTGADDHESISLERMVDKNKVTICRALSYCPQFVNNPLELNVLLTMGGIEPTPIISADDVGKCLLRDVHCRIHDKALYINRLFEHNDGSFLHPYYVDDIFAPYTKLRFELEEQINKLKAMHNTKTITEEINEFVRIYRMMICSRLPILIIGGSTIDHLANINVVNDVLGVVSVAMKHGVILDLLPKFYFFIDRYMEEHPESVSYLRSFKQSIASFCQLTYKHSNPLDTKQLIKTAVHQSSIVDFKVMQMMFINDRGLWSFMTNSNRERVIVVQSYRAIRETIVRLIETVPRLIQVDKIIVPNSVMESQ